ncbi:MAG: DUF3007 family protein [Symploca sp. SIO2E9]|nr:DUF3007 family protein [Symploca sp. SIO2E9]
MRRIDAIGIGIGVFAAGGLIYVVLQIAGLDRLQAGIWTQAVLVGGLIGWLLTYLFRVGTKNMTYNQQLKDYEEAVLNKRLEAMTPEELAQLQTEIEQEAGSQTVDQQ